MRSNSNAKQLAFLRYKDPAADAAAARASAAANSNPTRFKQATQASMAKLRMEPVEARTTAVNAKLRAFLRYVDPAADAAAARASAAANSNPTRFKQATQSWRGKISRAEA